MLTAVMPSVSIGASVMESFRVPVPEVEFPSSLQDEKRNGVINPIVRKINFFIIALDFFGYTINYSGFSGFYSIKKTIGLPKGWKKL
jgi:hypothetical protein